MSDRGRDRNRNQMERREDPERNKTKDIKKMKTHFQSHQNPEISIMSKNSDNFYECRFEMNTNSKML